MIGIEGKDGQGYVRPPAPVTLDRVGSIRQIATSPQNQFFPYGEVRSVAPSSLFYTNAHQYATYEADWPGYESYDAWNRSYNASKGRFNTPDPYQASGGPADPGSWNRYSYVGNDPPNYIDRRGLWRDLPPESEYPIAWPDDFPPFPVLPISGPTVGERESRPWFLQVKANSDCYRVPGNGGPVTREILYELIDDSYPTAYRFVPAFVVEHLAGDLPLSGATTQGPFNGTFEDSHSVLVGKDPQILNQTFSVTTNHEAGIKIFVRGFMNSLGDPQDYSVLNVHKTSRVIYINGDPGGSFDKNGNFVPKKICD